MSWRHLCKTSWRRLEDVFVRCLENVLKTSWRCVEDVFARRLEDVLKRYWRGLEGIWLRQKYWSSSRRLEDVLKTYSEDVYTRANIFVFIKTSWRRLLKTKTRDVFKTSSRGLHQDQCLLGCEFEVSFVCDLIWTSFLSYFSKKIFAAFVEVTLWDWYYCFQWLDRFTYLCSFSFSSLLLKGGL